MLGSRLFLFGVIMNIMYSVTSGDSNFLTGANDIIAVRNQFGEIKSTPFNVQFGKKDIWIPRSGHFVNININGKTIPQSMILDGDGVGYFNKQKRSAGKPKYRFWSALFGTSDPEPNERSLHLTPDEFESVGLREGRNQLEYRVTTGSGTRVFTTASIYLLSNTSKIVVSDIDGTVTRSDVKGMILPVLGISDWAHSGIVQLYSEIAKRGYTILYLTSRSIGMGESTRDYLFNLREGDYKMPVGPVLLHVNSIFGAAQTELTGNPEMAKIGKLNVVKGLFPQSPFIAAYGNRDTDVIAYKAVNTPNNRIFRIDEDSNIETVGTGAKERLRMHLKRINSLY